jgi:hypothetical protein
MEEEKGQKIRVSGELTIDEQIELGLRSEEIKKAVKEAIDKKEKFIILVEGKTYIQGTDEDTIFLTGKLLDNIGLSENLIQRIRFELTMKAAMAAIAQNLRDIINKKEEE